LANWRRHGSGTDNPRRLDTAAIYRNEVGVGKAIAASGIPRNEIFVTSKLWNDDIRAGTEAAAFQSTLDKLKLEYCDLYLIHWPIKGRIIESWSALEKILNTKRVRAIGVSNYHENHLESLRKTWGVVPAVNQVELHPMLQQRSLRKYCAKHGIAVQAWSPLMQGKFAGVSVLEKLAKKHNRTVPQIILRWNLQSDILTIPKTVSASRMAENANIFDFELSREDLLLIESIQEEKRFGPDPENFDF
jgi:methylglyoxal/glyoxal reductase